MDCKHEKGYTLILTLGIVTIFAVISVLLLSVTFSGAQRSEAREEHTQVAELAEKGMQHMKNKLHHELVAKLGADGLEYDEYIKQFEALLKMYLCETGESIKSGDLETGSYEVCILEYENATHAEDDYDPRKKVTLRSIGKTEEQTKEVIYVIEVGTNTVPDALKYAISTVNPKETKRNSDGNVYLHGGVEVYGDMNVGNNLFTHSYGPGLRGQFANWRKTTLPVLYPANSRAHQSKIELGGKLYQFDPNLREFTPYIGGENRTNQSSKAFYDNHLNWQNLNYYKNSTIEQMFANTTNLPKVVERKTDPTEVQIAATINEYKNQLRPTSTYNNNRVSNFRKDDTVQFVTGIFSNSITFTKTNEYRAGISKQGKLVNFRAGTHRFDQMYVRGNVMIGHETTSENNSAYDNITIEGFTNNKGAQLFVDDNVTIQGANLKSNLTIYTTGNVTIRYTTIEGKEYLDGREGSLIMFSEGKINIANNSLYLDEPSELKGFFYSEEALEMFGVGSNIKIHGGIAARRITLNAVRGNYKNGSRNWKDIVQLTNLNSPSRLMIIYDTDLIENYLNMNESEPVIKEIDDASLIDRK